MQRISIPLLHTEKDIYNLNYPQDIEPGLYVWDENTKEAVLITDFTSVELHKTTASSRKRFATLKEIQAERELLTYPLTKYNTIIKWKAYKLATLIYNL